MLYPTDVPLSPQCLQITSNNVATTRNTKGKKKEKEEEEEEEEEEVVDKSCLATIDRAVVCVCVCDNRERRKIGGVEQR